MQRAETKMARLSECDGRFHGFGVADFTDQNNIRRLAQSVLQRRLKAMRVATDLALGHDRLFMPMDKLDGVFDGYDMTGFMGIAMVDHRRQSGRLAGACSTHHQYQTALGHGDIF